MIAASKRALQSMLSSIRVSLQPGVDDRPLRDMLQTWVLCIMVPAGALAWGTTRRPSVVVAATLATPLLAIAQGALGILAFRLHFGNAPLPCTPSHGVVVVQPHDDIEQENQQERIQQSTTNSKCNNQQCPYACLEGALQMPPIRLLVIGDSLAIGVGQSKSASPIMPEVIAKTLSKKLHGRVVYWTCHGAPGASTGWIVRELERGVHDRQVDDANTLDDEDSDDEREDGHPCHEAAAATNVVCKSSSTSETDDSSSSSSDESSATSTGRRKTNKKCDTCNHTGLHLLSHEEKRLWKHRLLQHSKRFYDQHRLGPYDVVIILTGSNDLKSAFFPFLLSGEDAEFRRQAKLRGGSYGLELRRLLETLEKKMTLQFRNLRATVIHSVEAATERIQESIEDTIERFAPGSFRLTKGDSNKAIRTDSERDIQYNASSASQNRIITEESPSKSGETRPAPVIVLPGMPSRTLPIFRTIPLRWLSVPIVDIMDSHKQQLASSHHGDLLFVKAPGVDDLADYEAGRGRVWEDLRSERTILSITDVQKRERHLIEAQMRSYFLEKGQSAAEAIALSKRSIWRRLLPALPIPAGYSVFSVDQIHPNEKGYDFWGRYIANSVVEELQRKRMTGHEGSSAGVNSATGRH